MTNLGSSRNKGCEATIKIRYNTAAQNVSSQYDHLRTFAVCPAPRSSHASYDAPSRLPCSCGGPAAAAAA
jgi:hypothetical protein